jgi:hypothetical protein
MSGNMLRTIVVLVGLAACSNNALATPLQLQLSSPLGGLGPFSVQFDDQGDGLLQIGEITSFSGISISPPATTFSGFYNTILFVPDMPGFATSTGSTCPVGHPGPCNLGNWIFFDGNTMADVNFGRFTQGTFTITPVQSSVPEPASGLLLGCGVLALLLVRRSPLRKLQQQSA